MSIYVYYKIHERNQYGSVNDLKKNEIVKTAKIRKLQHLGHIMKHSEWLGRLQKVFQDKIEGKGLNDIKSIASKF